MIAKLIELWIDSASERSYQAAFCQILAARGYRLLHSTRHRPLELGKDIIAIAPTRKACVYQLKGNPSGYMTISAFQAIQQQIITMIAVPPTLDGKSARRFDAHLVTNGRIDEEVQEAIGKLDAACRARTYAADSLKTIARDEMLADAVELGASLWPSEVEDEDLLMQLLVADGREPYPESLGDALLARVLALSAPQLSAAELERRVTSAGLLNAIALRRFSAQNNYAAEAHAWTLLYAMSCGAYEYRQRFPAKRAMQTLEAARSAIHDCLTNLALEARLRGHSSEGDAFTDFAFVRVRRTYLAVG